MSNLSEYDALLAKVSAFTGPVSARRAQDLQCRRGCAACCHVELTVSPVEAAAIRRHLQALPTTARAHLRTQAEQTQQGRCPMLAADDSCAIYEARPLVCRTQGLPLRYPHDLLPAATVRVRTAKGDVTWCPLNFTAAPPAGDSVDVLDAALVDRLLALVNLRHAAAIAQDPLHRHTLRSLATGIDPDAP